MKRGIIIFLVGILIFVALAFFLMYLSIPKTNLTGNLVSIDLPSDCDNSSFQQIWETIFKEPYSNIVIKTNKTISGGYCQKFELIKYIDEDGYDKVFFVYGERFYFLNSYYKNLAYYYWEISDLNSTFSLNASEFIESSILSFMDYLFLSKRMTTKERNSTIDTIEKARTEYQNYFKNNISKLNLTADWGTYFFMENIIDIWNQDQAYIFKHHVENVVSFLRIEANQTSQPQNCTSNWTAINTSCTQNDNYVVWYNDTRSCNNTTPPTLFSIIPPVNQTLDCDYDRNGIMGNFSSLSQTNINLQVYINSQLANISQVFNTTKTIEFKEGNLTRIKFNYNFSQPLNMKAIEIIKQPSSSSFGYLIINGINITKTLTLDKLNENSTKICIKNTHIEDISEISGNCTEDDEYLVNCPGESDNFICNIINNKFNVSGLTYSGVKEFIQQTSTNCTANWTCTSWSSCINNLKTRNCTDINNCNTTEGKPVTNQSCVPCVPEWNCTSWQSEECPKNETQKRICTDINNCGISTEKPAETQTCIYEEKRNWLFIAIVIILAIFIIAIIILLIHLLNKKPEQQYSPTTQHGYTQGQPPYYGYRS